METDRLLLRPLTFADAQLLWELDADPQVMRHISRGTPTPLEVIQREVLPRWLEVSRLHAQLGHFAAHEKIRGEFIGWFHLKPYLNRLDELEIGYRLHRRFWKQGYATEGARLLIEVAFALPETERVVGTTRVVNRPSRRVLLRAGLHQESKFFYPAEVLPDWPEEERRAVRYVLERKAYEQGELAKFEEAARQQARPRRPASRIKRRK